MKKEKNFLKRVSPWQDTSSAMDIQAIRSRLVDKGLLYFALILPLGLCISLFRAFDHGWHPIYLLHLAVTGLLLAGTIYRGRLSYRLRACLLLGTILTLGTAGLVVFGLVGGGISLLIVFAALSTIAFGTRAGLIACAANLGIIGIIALSVTSGLITYSFDIALYSTSFSGWNAIAVVFVIFVPVSIIAFGVVHAQLVSSLEELQENQQQQERLANNLTDSFLYRHDSEGVFSYVSTSASKVLGYSSGELLTHVIDYLTDHPVNLEATVKIEQSKKGVRQTPYEIEIYHKDGSKRWLEISETPVFSSDGQVVAVEGVAHNITIRKHSEEVVKELIKATSTRSGHSFFEAMAVHLAKTLNAEYTLICELAKEHGKPETLAATLGGKLVDLKKNDLSGTPLASVLLKVGSSPLSGVTRQILPHKGLKPWDTIGCAGVWLLGSQNMPLGFMVVFLKNPQDNPDFADAILQIFSSRVGHELVRTRAEKAVRDSEEKFRDLVESSSDWIWEVNNQGVYTYASPQVQTLLGYSPVEVIGKTPFDLMPEECSEKISKKFSELMSAGEPITALENTNFHKDGQIVILETSGVPIFDDGGKISGYRGVDRDITDRKKAEEEWRKLAAVVQHSSELVNLATLEGDMLFLNEAGCKMLGIEKSAVLQTHIMDVIPEDRVELVQNEMLQALERDGHWEGDLQYSNQKTKELVDVHAITFHINDPESGDPQFLANLSLDISERKQAEKEREKLEGQLRQAQKMEAIGQLAGGVAHDFNNLLQIILGYGEMALTEHMTSGDIRSSIEQVLKATDRAKTLVSQLLAFSRRQVLDIQDVNLNDLMVDLVNMIRRVIGEHISLNIISGRDLGVVRADPGQIEQILMNLCVNSRDAMPNGGTITIETENVLINESYCTTHPWAEPGRYALLSVTDTGCGMDEATLANIFDPFFTTKGVGEGTGLGLAMVYGLVKQHQGMVLVYSEVDKGTTFKIYLPLFERAAAEIGNKITGPVPGGTETILLAEDNEMVRNLSELFLKDAGYTVLTTENGEEALSTFEANVDTIDLALLDVVMPKLGGRVVYEKIKAKRPEIAVLFASGYSMNAVHTNFILDEDLSLIQKPYHKEDLLRKVREVIDNKNSSKQD